MMEEGFIKAQNVLQARILIINITRQLKVFS